MSIMNKIRGNSSIKDSAILNKSRFFNDKDMIPTSIPMINVALSGRLTGGLTPGLTMWAGPSKNFKTLFALLMAKAYMDKYPESAMLFYDSEFGAPLGYFDSLQMDKNRILHSPLTNIEELKFDIMKQLQELGREDKIIIIIDSIGNLASKKEIDDTLEQKSVADMTRAKQIKSLFRMVTPHLNLKDIPLVVVNHTYKEIGLYPKDIVGGGTGSYYSADNIYIIGRQQEKDGTELLGYRFIINVEKSRYVKEKSKIPVTVSFDDGISRWSGLLDLALESGHVIKPTNGWYSRVNLESGEIEDKKYRIGDTDTKDFWLGILNTKTFQEFVKNKYCMDSSGIISSQDVDDLFNDTKTTNGTA